MKSLGPLIGLAAVYVFFMMWAGEPPGAGKLSLSQPTRRFPSST